MLSSGSESAAVISDFLRKLNRLSLPGMTKGWSSWLRLDTYSTLQGLTPAGLYLRNSAKLCLGILIMLRPHYCHGISNHWQLDSLLTHWGRDKKAAIFQTTFSTAFSWMKMLKSWLKFHWYLFLSVQSTIFQHWFGLCPGSRQATSHHMNQWWSVCRHIYVSMS